MRGVNGCGFIGGLKPALRSASRVFLCGGLKPALRSASRVFLCGGLKLALRQDDFWRIFYGKFS